MNMPVSRLWLPAGLVLLAAAAGLVAAPIEVANSAALKDAARNAGPGTRILLAGGTYQGDCKLTGLRGGPEAFIEILAADPAHPPVFEGGDVTFQLIDCAYVLVDGIVARGASVNNIQVGDGSHHVILKDCTSQDIRGQGNCDGIKAPGLTDFLFYKCTVANWGGEGSAIDMVGCARGLLYKCRFSYPDVKGTTANTIQPKGGTNALGIYRCVFDRANFRAVQFGGATGKQYFFQGNFGAGYEGLDMAAIGNVIASGECAVAFVSCTRCRFEYNTVIDPTGYVIRVLHEGAGKPAADNTFSNNLIVYGDLREVLNRGGPADLASFTFAHNYWYKRRDPDKSIPKLPAEQADPAGGKDPRLNRDFQPAADSPARDYGAFAPGMEKAWPTQTGRFSWAWQQAQRLDKQMRAIRQRARTE
jgi:hypothetical protein